MRAGERPSARPRVRVEARVSHRRQVDRCLPVPQLTDVEVVLLSRRAPGCAASRGIRRTPPDPCAGRGRRARRGSRTRSLPRCGLQHRRLRLLHLQDRAGPGAATAREQQHPRARADASDADDLARDVDVLVRAEQVAPVLVEARRRTGRAGRGRSRTRRAGRSGRADRRSAPAAARRCGNAARRRPAR